MKRMLHRTGTLAISITGLLTLMLLPASADDSGHAAEAATGGQASAVTMPDADTGSRPSSEYRSAIWEW